MVALVFKNCGQGAAAIVQFLKLEFGLVATVQGTDVVVDSGGTQPKQHDFLVLGDQSSLTDGNELQISRHLLSLASEAMKKGRKRLAEEPPQYGRAGIVADVAAALDSLMLSADSDAAQHVASVIIPLMRGELKASSVSGVQLQTENLQHHLSRAKIMLLASKFGFAKAGELIEQTQPLSGTLPLAVHVLGYLDAMTRSSPLALTLPVHYLDSAWHFQAKGMWNFDRVIANGLMPEFMLRLSPLTRTGHLLGFHGLNKMTEENIWRMLRFVVKGINRLLSWLVDPRNFADATTKEVQLLRQVQAHSAVHLLFADISAMNFCTDAHTRVSLATGAIDKFANLRVEVGSDGGPENAAFQRLCSEGQRDALTVAVGKRCDDFGYIDLKDALTRMIQKSYNTLHEELGAQTTSAKKSESERMARLWAQRNVRHGAFLRKEQFERLYLEGRGDVPSTIASIPFLLMLGLMSDPDQFLNSVPTIGP